MVNLKRMKRAKKRKYKEPILRESCAVKEFLNDIRINWDDYTKLNDGSCIFLISNIDEREISILKGIGFIGLGYNLFRFETDEVNVNEKLSYIKPFYRKKQKIIWKEIIDKIIRIERKYSSSGNKCPFEPSIFQIKVATKWDGNIVIDDVQFKDFVTDLNSLFIESLTNNLDDRYKKHSFWQITTALRHWYSGHDTTRWRDKDRIKNAKKISGFFQNLIEKEWPDSSVSFVRCQFELLENCLNFLDSLMGEG